MDHSSFLFTMNRLFLFFFREFELLITVVYQFKKMYLFFH